MLTVMMINVDRDNGVDISAGETEACTKSVGSCYVDRIIVIFAVCEE